MDITELIHCWQQGDNVSEARLFSATYHQLKVLAKEALSKQQHTNPQEIEWQNIAQSTTCLAHDAYLKLAFSEVDFLSDRKSFYLLVAKSMRHILVDNFRKKNSVKRKPCTFPVDFSPNKNVAIEPYVLLDNAIVSLHTEHQRSSETLQLKYFFGFTNGQIAQLQNMSISTVEKDLKFARRWVTNCLVSE